jgi:hypothetical protein
VHELEKRRKSVQQELAAGDRRKKGVLKLRRELDSQPTAVSDLPPFPRHLIGRTRDVWQFLMAQYVFLPEDAPGPEDREGWCVSAS